MSMCKTELENHFQLFIKALTDGFYQKLENGQFENCKKTANFEKSCQNLVNDTLSKFKQQVIMSCLLEVPQSSNKPPQSGQKSIKNEHDISTKHTTPQDINTVPQTVEKQVNVQEQPIQVQNWQNNIQHFQWEGDQVPIEDQGPNQYYQDYQNFAHFYHQIENSSKKCKYFPNCRYMMNCRYKHPSKKQCWDYLYYECNNTDCQYLHSKYKICINLTKNNFCKFMENCRFYHPPVPAEGQPY